MMMLKRYALVVVLVILCLLVVLPGCNTGDIWSSLFEANEYIAIVGQNMHARGWPDFPDNAVAWTMFVSDLKGSINSAKSAGVKTTGAVRDIERDVIAIPEPDMKKLNEAFKSNPDW